ncbi:hypothetical protein [Streptomyces sp. NPDC047928]|uniref:hypothetical protein n=1 Tax=unclassified Streptomyces TaxID=2593676 RepID=UPI003721BCB5
MADERYEWLDQAAAERLLRGEPVDAADDRARTQADRLAEALRAARLAYCAGGAPSAALPGEEAALAAFREARATSATSSAASATTTSVAASAPTSVTGSDLGAVRIGGAPRPFRWARPARWGLAASVAGLAVGGVAVAAGTGVLTPFGDDRTPVPSASVSAAATADPRDSGHAAGGHDSGTPTAPADPGALPSSPAPGSGPWSLPPGSGRGDDNDGATTGPGREPGGDPARTPDDGTSSGSSARLAQACRDYRAGRIDSAAKRSLEAEARGGSLKGFCDDVLDGDQDGSGTRDGDSGGGADGGSGRPGTESGDGERDGDSGRTAGTRSGDGGSVPSVSWTAPAQTGSTAAAQPAMAS